MYIFKAIIFFSWKRTCDSCKMLFSLVIVGFQDHLDSQFLYKKNEICVSSIFFKYTVTDISIGMYVCMYVCMTLVLYKSEICIYILNNPYKG